MKPALVVLGAAGRVGRGIVAAAAAEGRPIIAVARRQADLRRLREEFPAAELTLTRGTVDSDSSARRLVLALRAMARPVSAVLVAICSESNRGRVLEQTSAALRRTLNLNLMAHLNAARHLLPWLAEAARPGNYLLLGGPGAERPWCGYGHRSIVAASLQMLARVLHEEARSTGVRVHMLSVESPLRHAENLEHACDSWPTPQAVGRHALRLLEPDPRGAPPAVIRFTPPAGETHSVDARALIARVISNAQPKDCSP